MPPRKSQRRQQILEALAQMLEANPGDRITTAGLAKQQEEQARAQGQLQKEAERTAGEIDQAARENTLNQLLTEMDGFDTNTGVIILAATNRADILDRALLRAGRFDRQIVVDKPDLTGREQILRLHSKGVKLDAAVNLRDVARRTAGLR